MNKLPVKLSEEHIRRVANCAPLDALIELVWNSLDAGATKVEVQIIRNKLGGVETIEIEDNGDGISQENIEQSFGSLGHSIKKPSELNSRGKPYHGKLGEGRFKAYSLGNKITWKTKSTSTTGIQIVGNSSNPSFFEISELKSPADKGTCFTALNSFSDKLKLPGDEVIFDKLSITFAPKLLSDSAVKIQVGGLILNPRENIDQEKTENLASPYENSQVKTVVWKKGKEKELLFCDSNFLARSHDECDLDFDGGCSIFIASPLVEQAVMDNTVSTPGLTELNGLKETAISYARNFLEEVAHSKMAGTIKKLKERKVYPYDDDPKSEIDHVERRVFDICTTKIIESIPTIATGSKPSQKLFLNLLRQSIETSPSSLRNILEKVLNLPQEEISKLSDLLGKVSLEGLIKLGKMVNDRFAFLNGLDQLVLDPDWNKRVKERAHLHKFLEQEIWIFGEQFSLGTSDEKLSTILEYHRSLLNHGEDEQEAIDSTGGKGMQKIPDLVMGMQNIDSSGVRYEHLVVELKRPTVNIGLKEKSQIEQYALTVSQNPGFDKHKTKWMFYAISAKIDDDVIPMLSQANREPGQFFISPDGNVQIFIKTWGEIFQAAKGRMQFLKAKIEDKTSKQDGIAYLREKYPKIMGEIEQ